MSNKFDYSLYSSLETWTLNDAQDIIVNYAKDLALDGNESEGEIKQKAQILSEEFSDAVFDFADDVKYCRKILYIDDSGDPEYDCNLSGGPKEIVDYLKTTVSKPRFIVWASKMGIPLPDDIVRIVRGNAANNGLTDEYAHALNELFLLKKQFDELSAEKAKWEASSLGLLSCNINDMVKYAFELGESFGAQSFDQNKYGVDEISKHLKKCFKNSKPTEQEVNLLLTNFNEYHNKKATSIKMADISNKSRSATKNIKKKITKYVLQEIQPPCTCLHSQMKDHIINGVTDPETGKFLWLESYGVTEKVVLNTVKNAYVDAREESRIKTKNIKLPVCSVHPSVT